MTGKSKIGLGTVQFGLPYGISNKEGQTPVQEAKNILNLARKKNIDVVDSASAYGNAEEVLGNNNLQDFKVVSKFMPPSPGEKIIDQLEQSLRKLRLPSLYGYLAHRPLDLLKFSNHWNELKNFKEEGKVEKIGFSLNEPEEMELLLNSGFLPDLVQVPYNYFDRRFDKYIKELKEKGCEIHARSVFLQGLFFMKPRDLSNFFDEVKPYLEKLQAQEGSLSGNLLKFVIENTFIDRAVIGIENEQQLSQNIDGVKKASILPELKKRISDKIVTPSKWPKK